MFLLLVLLSCTRESPVPENQIIELTLTTGGEMETRAGADGVKDGEDTYNENLISWVDLFFYPGGETEADAVYHIRRESGKRRMVMKEGINICHDSGNRYKEQPRYHKLLY